MKMLFLALAFIGCCATSLSAKSRVISHWYDCNGAGTRSFYYVLVVIDEDTGCPTGASGVDCNGNVWSAVFSVQPHTPGQTYPATWIESIDDNLNISVKATDEVDFRIFDLQTGQYVGNTYHVSGAGSVVSVALSSLPKSAYGVISFKNGVATSISQFVR